MFPFRLEELLDDPYMQGYEDRLLTKELLVRWASDKNSSECSFLFVRGTFKDGSGELLEYRDSLSNLDEWVRGFQ